MQEIDSADVTRDPGPEVAVEVADDHESRPESPDSFPVPWEKAVQCVAGVYRVHGVRPVEAAAVAAWVDALEADLAEPANAADRAILGSLARVSLLELRAARTLFDRGLLTGAPKGKREVRGLLGEFRALVNTKATLLSRLTFHRGKRQPVNLTDYLKARRAADGSSGRPEATDATAARELSDEGKP